MKYTEPKIEFLTPAQDEIMVSLDDLYAIDLWDMLLS